MSEPLFPTFFAALKAQYFDPLCNELGLATEASSTDADFGYASASSGNVKVFFEYERGLGFFSLGPINAAKPLCALEMVAARFPPIGMMHGGNQRLNLGEQIVLIADHWAELQEMFSIANFASTRQWQESMSAAHMKQFASGQ